MTFRSGIVCFFSCNIVIITLSPLIFAAMKGAFSCFAEKLVPAWSILTFCLDFELSREASSQKGNKEDKKKNMKHVMNQNRNVIHALRFRGSHLRALRCCRQVNHVVVPSRK